MTAAFARLAAAVADRYRLERAIVQPSRLRERLAAVAGIDDRIRDTVSARIDAS